MLKSFWWIKTKPRIFITVRKNMAFISMLDLYNLISFPGSDGQNPRLDMSGNRGRRKTLENARHRRRSHSHRKSKTQPWKSRSQLWKSRHHQRFIERISSMFPERKRSVEIQLDHGLFRLDVDSSEPRKFRPSKVHRSFVRSDRLCDNRAAAFEMLQNGPAENEKVKVGRIFAAQKWRRIQI